MDEVLPGLWVGDLACALSTEYLSLAGVTHIVTALKSRLPPPPPLPCGRSIPSSNLLHIPIDDEEHEPIIVHFPVVNDFIHDVLEEQWVEGPAEEELNERRDSDGKYGHWETTGAGTVLVHCQAGCSRSVALVAAYIMSTRHFTPAQAVAVIKARREQSEPNTGFMDQLQLYYQADFQVDLRHAPIRRFLMSKINVLNGDSVEDVLMSYYPSPGPSPIPSPSLQRSSSSSSATSTRSTSSLSRGLSELSTMDGTHLTQRRRRPSRSSIGSSARPEIIQQLSKSPPMPKDTDALFNAASRLRGPPSQWATSISSPHEVLVARSRGNRLPGGVANIKGHESRRGTAMAAMAASSSSSSSQHPLPKPNYRHGTMRLRCKMCRREIAARDHVVEHEPGQGIQAFDVRRRNKELRSGSRNEKLAVGLGQEPNGEADGSETHIPHTQTAGQTDSSYTQTDGETNDSHPQSKDTHADGQPASAPEPSPHTTQQGRPIQSAASLTASLPPHLAALRAGRAPPGAEAAQQRALEQSRARAAASQVQPPTAAASPSHQTPRTASTTHSQPSKHHTQILHSPDCSAYFLEPLDWMYNTQPNIPSPTSTKEAQSLSSGNLSGKLLCPNATRGKCNAKLGNWDWAGMQCGCGAWVTPGFAVARGRVDEVWE